MVGGMSYANVQAAVGESENIVSDPPRDLDMNLHARTSPRSTASLDPP
jgi:hypothetical protein